MDQTLSLTSGCSQTGEADRYGDWCVSLMQHGDIPRSPKSKEEQEVEQNKAWEDQGSFLEEVILELNLEN